MEDLFRFVVNLPQDVKTASILISIGLGGYILFRATRYFFNWLEKRNGLRVARKEEQLWARTSAHAEKKAIAEKGRTEALREQADLELSLNALYAARDKLGVQISNLSIMQLGIGMTDSQTWRLAAHFTVPVTLPSGLTSLVNRNFTTDVVVETEETSPEEAGGRAHDILMARLRSFLNRELI